MNLGVGAVVVRCIAKRSRRPLPALEPGIASLVLCEAETPATPVADAAELGAGARAAARAARSAMSLGPFDDAGRRCARR